MTGSGRSGGSRQGADAHIVGRHRRECYPWRRVDGQLCLELERRRDGARGGGSSDGGHLVKVARSRRGLQGSRGLRRGSRGRCLCQRGSDRGPGMVGTVRTLERRRIRTTAQVAAVVEGRGEGRLAQDVPRSSSLASERRLAVAFPREAELPARSASTITPFPSLSSSSSLTRTSRDVPAERRSTLC
jgi:hypothetical protein